MIDINIAKDNPVFSSIDGVMFDKSGSTLIKYPKGRKETHYTIPEAVIEINKEAFEDCKNLKKINVDKKKGSIIEESWYAREGIEIVWQE